MIATHDTRQNERQNERQDGDWVACLELEFAPRRGKTVLARRSQRGPLTTQRAFYPEGGLCHVYVLHPPGGIVGGDSLSLSVTVQAGANALLTTPGASKFYRSQGRTSYQGQTLQVAEQGTLEWLPQENIYFPGARVQASTKLRVAAQARFIVWETHCLGLPVNNERFSSGNLQLDFSLCREERPVLTERLSVNAKRLDAPTGLRGRPVTATFAAGPANTELLAAARTLLDNDDGDWCAATLVEDCLLVRYLGDSTARCRQLFSRLWQAVRPHILHRPACPPRIWAT